MEANGIGCWTTTKRQRPTGWSLIIDLASPSHRLILALAQDAMAKHSGVRKTQQLHRRSGRAGSTCSNVLAFKTLAGQHPGDQDCRRGLASCVLATRAREEGWGRPLHGITLHSGCCRSCAGQNVDDYDSCVDFKPLGIASQGLEPEQCSSRQHLSAAKRGDLVLLDKI